MMTRECGVMCLSSWRLSSVSEMTLIEAHGRFQDSSSRSPTGVAPRNVSYTTFIDGWVSRSIMGRNPRMESEPPKAPYILLSRPSVTNCFIVSIFSGMSLLKTMPRTRTRLNRK